LHGDAEHFGSRSHFQIESGLHCFPQYPYVPINDVPAVFTQMNRDSVSACQLYKSGGGYRIWFTYLPCLSYCGNVIDVDV
jgi:hypothetical protein